MKQRIYHSGDIFSATYIDVEATDIVVNQVLCSKDEITMKIESETALAFSLGWCYAPENAPTSRYLLNELPTYEKRSSTSHVYTLTFQGLMHDLSKIALLGPNDECEFFYNGRAIDFVNLIVARMSNAQENGYLISRWHTGTTALQGLTETTEFKNIQFSNQTCWQALNSICDEFDFEFEIKELANTYLYLSIKKLVGNATGTTISYGKGYGIKNIKRTNINVDKLITRLYYLGSDQNLPADYTGGTRLKGTSTYKSLNVDTYGRRDGFQTFEDIKPSFTGTVTSFGINSEKENLLVAPFPFDLLEVDSNGDTLYLIGGTTAKIVFLTGDCAGYTFDIVDKGFDWDGTNATISLIKYTDEAGNEWPNLTVKPNASDTFTIVDIRMPSVYLSDAVALLDAAASEYLAKYSTPRVQYTLETDPKYCSAQNIYLRIGNKITVSDSDLSISETCRVLEISYKLHDKFKATVKLSDVRFAIPTRKLKMQLKELEVITRATKAKSATKILKGRKTTNELKTSILDVNDNKFNTERVRNESIDPVGLAYDSGEVQYSMKETKLKSTEAGIEYTDGIVVHHSFNAKTRAEIKKLQKNGLTYSPTRTWTLAAGSSEVAANKSAYIYLKLPLLAAETAATIFTSETHLWAKSQTNYILYKLGSVGAVVDGKRDLSVLWGGGGHLPLSIALNAAEILSVNDNQVLDINLSAYAKITDLHNALIVNLESEPYLTVTEDQVISLNLSAFDLHPPVSLGTGSETELALNPTTQVLTLTGLKKTFLSLNDTFDAYPAGGLGYMLISGDSSVLYSQAFGSDSEGAWAQITPEIENVGSNILSNTYFSPSTGWTIGSPWVIQSFGNPPPYDYAAYFSATGSGIISQQITLESGKTYRVELFASDYETTPLVEVLIDGSVVATATEGDSSRYSADFESTITGTATLGIKATSPGTLAVFTVTVSEVTITAGRGLRMCNSGHATQYILPTSAPSENDVVFARADGQLVFGQINDFLPDTFLLDTDFPTAGLMLTDGAGNYSVITDNSATWNTALVDADFASNGIMVRTGAGTYSTVADNSATWNTLASLGTKTFWNGTQAAYDAIGTKDSNTIYFINV